MKEPPPLAVKRKEEREDDEKGRHGGDNTLTMECLLARHIPAGSQVLNRHDPQNQHRSKVRQALTFPEKIPCSSPLLHSFKMSLASILIPALVFHDAHHFFPLSASPH